MKIAFMVLRGLSLCDGIAKYTEELGSRLASRGHEIVVYTMRHYGATDGVYKGMKVKTVPTIKSKGLEKLFASFSAALAQCWEKNVDIVHFHAFGPSMFSFVPRLMGRHVVVQGHGIEWRRSRWGAGGRLFLRLSEVPSVRFPNAVTVVSEEQKRYLERKYGIESTCIPTGVNLPHIEAPDIIKEEYGLEGNDYILFAARLVREKGAHYLIEAYRRLKTDMKLVIAGDASYEEKYKAELKELAEGDTKIIFPGFVTEKKLHELYSNCYLFVLPSEIEGLSTALLEAMSYANCTLVSDIPENLEAQKDLGYTFKNKDVDDLEEKLRELIENPPAVNSRKERARAHVLRNYSWDAIAERFETFYLNVLAKRTQTHERIIYLKQLSACNQIRRSRGPRTTIRYYPDM